MYFAILCYYLIFNVFKRIKWMRAVIACFIGLLSLIYLLILIDSFIDNVQSCKGIFIYYWKNSLIWLWILLGCLCLLLCSQLIDTMKLSKKTELNSWIKCLSVLILLIRIKLKVKMKNFLRWEHHRKLILINHSNSCGWWSLVISYANLLS